MYYEDMKQEESHPEPINEKPQYQNQYEPQYQQPERY